MDNKCMSPLQRTDLVSSRHEKFDAVHLILLSAECFPGNKGGAREDLVNQLLNLVVHLFRLPIRQLGCTLVLSAGSLRCRITVLGTQAIFAIGQHLASRVIALQSDRHNDVTLVLVYLLRILLLNKNNAVRIDVDTSRRAK
jgi:hypothetical protein